MLRNAYRCGPKSQVPLKEIRLKHILISQTVHRDGIVGGCRQLSCRRLCRSCTCFLGFCRICDSSIRLASGCLSTFRLSRHFFSSLLQPPLLNLVTPSLTPLLHDSNVTLVHGSYNDRWFVVHKPAGWTTTVAPTPTALVASDNCHGSSCRTSETRSPSVENALSSFCAELFFPTRLDKCVDGLLIVATDRHMHGILTEHINKGLVSVKYRVIVDVGGKQQSILPDNDISKPVVRTRQTAPPSMLKSCRSEIAEETAVDRTPPGELQAPCSCTGLNIANPGMLGNLISYRSGRSSHRVANYHECHSGWSDRLRVKGVSVTEACDCRKSAASDSVCLPHLKASATVVIKNSRSGRVKLRSTFPGNDFGMQFESRELLSAAKSVHIDGRVSGSAARCVSLNDAVGAIGTEWRRLVKERRRIIAMRSLPGEHAGTQGCTKLNRKGYKTDKDRHCETSNDEVSNFLREGLIDCLQSNSVGAKKLSSFWNGEYVPQCLVNVVAKCVRANVDKYSHNSSHQLGNPLQLATKRKSLDLTIRTRGRCTLIYRTTARQLPRDMSDAITRDTMPWSETVDQDRAMLEVEGVRSVQTLRATLAALDCPVVGDELYGCPAHRGAQDNYYDGQLNSANMVAQRNLEDTLLEPLSEHGGYAQGALTDPFGMVLVKFGEDGKSQVSVVPKRVTEEHCNAEVSSSNSFNRNSNSIDASYTGYTEPRKQHGEDSGFPFFSVSRPDSGSVKRRNIRDDSVRGPIGHYLPPASDNEEPGVPSCSRRNDNIQRDACTTVVTDSVDEKPSRISQTQAYWIVSRLHTEEIDDSSCPESTDGAGVVPASSRSSCPVRCVPPSHDGTAAYRHMLLTCSATDPYMTTSADTSIVSRAIATKGLHVGTSHVDSKYGYVCQPLPRHSTLLHVAPPTWRSPDGSASAAPVSTLKPLPPLMVQLYHLELPDPLYPNLTLGINKRSSSCNVTAVGSCARSLVEIPELLQHADEMLSSERGITPVVTVRIPPPTLWCVFYPDTECCEMSELWHWCDADGHSEC
eukprot:GHVQ01006854.1.p1 GENE.GHVQ01006854.1~~GHVQ01006854.1.p1  ORF type:complete len:1032 (+),score=112.92 GHVQ01006854.1:242-3337(+)